MKLQKKSLIKVLIFDKAPNSIKMISKTEIYNSCIKVISEKLQNNNNALKEITEDAKSDSKSSAGDKHETSRAMIQIEQERIIDQIEKLREQKNQLKKININLFSNRIVKGSLILTDHGYFFLSIAIGKIIVSGTQVFVLSHTSPLGSKLMGLKKSDSVIINGIKYLIKDFC